MAQLPENFFVRLPGFRRSAKIKLGWYGALAAALAMAIVTMLAPPCAYGQHGAGGGHTGGGHAGGGHVAGGGGGHSAPAAAPVQHYIPVQAARPAVAAARPAAGSPHTQGGVGARGLGERPGGAAAYGGAGVSGQGNRVQMLGAAAGTPQHVTIGYPPNPLEHGFTVGEPRHLAGTTVSGTVRFEGQGRDVWASALHGTTMGGPSAGSGAPAGWSVIAERGAGRPGWPRGGPRQGPIFGRGVGVVAVGSPFFGWGPGWGLGFGYGFGLGWEGTCGPYWRWGFGCNALPYGGAGFGYGADGYFLNAAPYEASNWPNDLSLQNGGTDGNAPLTFPYEAPTAEEEQNNLRADQTETVIFLSDGGVDLVNDYWVAGGKLHYVNGGGENVIPLEQVDIQKTVDVNASRGLTVTLRPSPEDAAGDAPAATGGANATAGANGPAGGTNATSGGANTAAGSAASNGTANQSGPSQEPAQGPAEAPSQVPAR